MTQLDEPKPARKVLTLKKEHHKPVEGKQPPHFVNDRESVYMVWCADGGMPKRVYRPDERSLAESHAKRLAFETQRRFFVLRAWRGYDPA